ncbi:sensor histidine kinase [Chelativorans salis]|uniref:histidine kinase n=1 Tax=Chelativorans salis TaxID=2978478 RepID=A0ABT2LJX7_9HYPH|nr:DUF4118 domain-containing protein [Chelativorans sp. EGI FJ00035]MCT7373713.1 DUF4118 domain-containing protein [Chelativorans sp. EGI FJ00035]
MNWLLNEPLPTRTWPVWARYVTTFLIVAAATALDLWLWPRLNGYPFLIFILAVVVTALLFDRGSGFFALVLSIAALAYLFLAPYQELTIAEERDFFVLILFSAVGLLIASSIEMMHVAVHRLYLGNQRLTISEREKDILLRDCNHRTRNHLAMLASMIRLQEHGVEEPAARSALTSIGERVQVMVKVHDRLMQASGEAVIDTYTFVTDLCDDLRASLMGLRPISLTVEVERHHVPQSTAVSIGLCVNELLTNTLKYAFPQDQAGEISVVFAREGDDFRLTVTDNGVGFAEGTQLKSKGLGQRLVRSLAAQYGGSFEFGPRQDGSGTTAIVRFPVETGPT